MTFPRWTNGASAGERQGLPPPVGPLVLAVLLLTGCQRGGNGPTPEDEAGLAGTARTSLPAPLAGTGSCSGRGCHGALAPRAKEPIFLNEYTSWADRDPHARAYDVLLNDQSKAIAHNLGLQNPHESARCLACHTNPLLAGMGRNPTGIVWEELSSGVGCEACHGGAEGWLVAHTGKGWAKKGSGMNDLGDFRVRAEICAGCHVGTGERDVNHDLIAAGHPRLNFELAAYCFNLPKHWNEAAKAKDRPADSEGRLWAAGQFVSARSALALLAFRAREESRPWPEFAESDCYACHHDLAADSWRQKRGFAGRTPGTLPWSDWYFAMPRLLAGPVKGNEWKGLENEMARPLPNRATVGQLAGNLYTNLGIELERWSAKDVAARPLVRALVKAYPVDGQWTGGAAHLAPSWDSAAQLYLAVAALHQANPDPKVRAALPALLAELRFDAAKVPRWNSPRLFRPRHLEKALEPLRE